MIKRFFILCSGADKQLLNQCSDGEQNKYAGVGGTVFFTAVLAWMAAAYALYTVFEIAWLSIGFGFLWRLMIFNLNRYIVSTLRKSDSKWKEFLQALPRLALAFIIAVVITKPLELKVFEKEINNVLIQKQHELS